MSKQSNQFISKVKGLKIANTNETNQSEMVSEGGQTDIQMKLEETKKAFDETEHQLNH